MQKKNCSNIFQWILYKWKGMSTALFCLSIVASLGPTKPAVPVNKNVVLVMFNGWASPCCELFVGAGPNLFCFVVIAKNWRFPHWWSDFLEFVCETWNWIPFFRTCSLYWCHFKFSFKRPCFLVDGNVKTLNISAFQMEDAVVSLLVFELLKGGRY